MHYDPFCPYSQSFLSFRLIIVYHTSHYRTSVLSSFSAIHLPPIEEGEFLLTFVKFLGCLLCISFKKLHSFLERSLVIYNSGDFLKNKSFISENNCYLNFFFCITKIKFSSIFYHNMHFI